MPAPVVAAILALIARSGISQQAARMLTSRYLAKRLTANEVRSLINRIKDNRASNKEIKDLMRAPGSIYKKPAGRTAQEEIDKAVTPKGAKPDTKKITYHMGRIKREAPLDARQKRALADIEKRKQIKKALEKEPPMAQRVRIKEEEFAKENNIPIKDIESIKKEYGSLQKYVKGLQKEKSESNKKTPKVKQVIKQNRKKAAAKEKVARYAERETGLPRINAETREKINDATENPDIPGYRPPQDTITRREPAVNKEVGQKYKAAKDAPAETKDIYIPFKNPINGKQVMRNGRKVYIKITINTSKGQSEKLAREAIERDLKNMPVLGARTYSTTPSGKPIIIGYRTYTPKQWMRLAEKETEKRKVEGLKASYKKEEKITASQIDKNISSQRKFAKDVATEKANKIDPISQANALKKNLEQLQKELEKAINRQSQSRIDKLLKEKDTLEKNLRLLEKRNKMTAPTRGA